MGEYLKKHWLYLLGTAFITMSILYFFKFAIELDVLSNILKVSIGLSIGALGVLIGFIFHKKMGLLTRELITGIGLGVIFTSSYIAGVYYEIWNLWLFLSVILGCSLTTLFISAKLQFRITSNISLIGLLLAPLLLTLGNNKIVLLSLYLGFTSIFYFIISFKKSWLELRVLSFIGTWFVYFSYINTNISYLEKNSYLLADIVIYLILAILLMYTMTHKNKIQTFDYVLSLYNGFLFVRYLPKISEYWYVKSGILIACGIIYIISASLLKYLFTDSKKHFLLMFLIGSFFILSAASSISIGKEFISLYIASIWTIAVILLLVFRKLFNIKELKVPVLILWLATSIYWFFGSWYTPVTKLFGFYLPLLNWSALVSILLATLGFLMVSKTTYGFYSQEEGKYLPTILRLISHIIICGLLAVQTGVMWKEYRILDIDSSLVLTLIWSIYSIVLLVRAIYNNLKLYRNFAIFILMVSSFKAFFIDLSSSKPLYKMIFLFVLGIITLIIAGLNKKWNELQIEKIKEIP